MVAYTTYPALADLPPLVRKQRRLEAQILPLAPLEVDEKAVRAKIFALFVLAGIPRGDGVTCLGYAVMRRGKKGNTTINADKLTAILVAAGVDETMVDAAVIESTETGEPSAWVEVKPSKGAKVRA